MGGLFLSGTMKSTINLCVKTGRGVLSCISLIFDFFLERKVAETYALGSCNWSLYLSIATIAECLASSGPKSELYHQH